VDGDPSQAFAMIRSQSAQPSGDAGDVVRPVAGLDRRGQADRLASARLARSAPDARPTDRQLDPDRRGQPEDVRALQQPDLDEAHVGAG
jgi:hypothetical protein